MTKAQPDYLAYLLRLWRANGENSSQSAAESVVWRVSLESPHTGEKKSFASLDDLFDFLRQQTGEGPNDVTTQTDHARNEG